MARKRMFRLDVLETDAFMDMPLTAQALYFHLNLRADDDGFIGNPNQIVRLIGANTDDLKLLIAKRFVLLFEDGVIVIKHWRMHNALSQNRYKETNFIEDKAMLRIKENNSYTLDPNYKPICDKKYKELACRQYKDNTKTIQRQDIDSTKTSLEEKRIDIEENSINNMCVKNTQVSASGSSKNNYSANFEEFWKCYPRRKEKAKAYKCYQTRLKDGFTEEELLRACKAYADECKKKHTEEQYIKLCATFIGPNTPFVDYLKGGDTDGRDSDTNSAKATTGEGIYDDFAREYLAKRGIKV